MSTSETIREYERTQEIGRRFDAMAQPTPKRSYKVQSLNDTPTSPPSVLVQRIGLAEGTVAAIVGPPNVSKTAFAIDLAEHLCAGEEWFSLKVRQTPVVYCAPEAPASVMMRARACALRKFDGEKLPFYLCGDVPGLGSDADSRRDTDRLIATIQEVSKIEDDQVRLVFIDTLASCLAGGDENGAGMLLLVAAVKRIAAETDACVVLVHHPSKAGEGRGLRGHGSLHGALDTVIEVATDEASGVRTATLTKSRDSATGLQLHYGLEVIQLPEKDQWGDAITTIVIEPTDASQRTIRPKLNGVNQQRAFNALAEYVRTNELATHITSAEVKALMDAQGINRHRRAEVLSYLTQARVITPSIGGFTLDRDMLK